MLGLSEAERQIDLHRFAVPFSRAFQIANDIGVGEQMIAVLALLHIDRALRQGPHHPDRRKRLRLRL